MKKIIFTLLLLLILTPVTVLAWDDCPYGEVFCDGECGRFVDTDNDGICDHSQSAPEDRDVIALNTEIEEDIHDLISGKDLKTKTIIEIAEIYQIDVNKYTEALSEFYKVNIKPTDSFQRLHDNYAVELSVAKDIALSLKTGEEITVTESENKNKGVYHLIPISLVLVFLYVISHVLSKKKIISLVNHRKIWNFLLLITFLASGILGILLVIRINFGVAIPLPFNILFWHVEIGIAMSAISVFHIMWHWSYYKNLFGIK